MCFGAFTLGDVLDCADPSLFPIGPKGALEQDDAFLATGTNQGKFQLETVVLQRRREVIADVVLFVCADESEHPFHGRGENRRLYTEDTIDFLGPAHLRIARLPVPGAETGNALRLRQASLAIAQILGQFIQCHGELTQFVGRADGKRIFQPSGGVSPRGFAHFHERPRQRTGQQHAEDAAQGRNDDHRTQPESKQGDAVILPEKIAGRTQPTQHRLQCGLCEFDMRVTRDDIIVANHEEQLQTLGKRPDDGGFLGQLGQRQVERIAVEAIVRRAIGQNVPGAIADHEGRHR